MRGNGGRHVCPVCLVARELLRARRPTAMHRVGEIGEKCHFHASAHRLDPAYRRAAVMPSEEVAERGVGEQARQRVKWPSA